MHAGRLRGNARAWHAGHGRASGRHGQEVAPINEQGEQGGSAARGGTIVNAGAVLAVLLGIPCFFIGVFGAVGLITGQKLVAGGLGALWGYAAVMGAYELNRRRFNWQRWSKYRDIHLMAGTGAVAVGLVIAGALHESMPALGLVCVLSAILQANDGHRTKYLAVIHVAIIAAGIWGGLWFHGAGDYGKYVLEYLGALP